MSTPRPQAESGLSPLGKAIALYATAAEQMNEHVDQHDALLHLFRQAHSKLLQEDAPLERGAPAGEGVDLAGVSSLFDEIADLARTQLALLENSTEEPDAAEGARVGAAAMTRVMGQIADRASVALGSSRGPWRTPDQWTLSECASEALDSLEARSRGGAA